MIGAYSKVCLIHLRMETDDSSGDGDDVVMEKHLQLWLTSNDDDVLMCLMRIEGPQKMQQTRLELLLMMLMLVVEDFHVHVLVELVVVVAEYWWIVHSLV